MERLIDADRLIKRYKAEKFTGYEEIIQDILDEHIVEAIPKADYENRLKADMVAMLEVIKLRIDNLPEPLNRDRVNYCIQQKINELEAESEPQESEE